MNDKTITVRVTRNYGIEAIYPVNEPATVFARIAGTKTLGRDTLNLAKKLGYSVVVEPVTL